ncbi:MAG: hypothetical protein RR824_07070 [Clostridia bacterium]
MKKPILIAAVCMLAAASLFFWGFKNPSDQVNSPSLRYVMIADSDTGTFFMQLRKGMQDAAREQNANFMVQTAHGEIAQQVASIKAQGTNCVLLLLDKPENWLKELSKAELPAVVIGQSVEGQTCVTTDDAATGDALITRALALTEGFSQARILVATDEQNERVKLLCEGMHLDKHKESVTLLEGVRESSELEGYQVIVAATESLTARISALRAGGLLSQCMILGVDTGDKRVSDLENGYVEALAFENPYALGYIALTRAAKSAIAAKAELFRCPGVLVDVQSMYDAENVKAVFPLLQ